MRNCDNCIFSSLALDCNTGIETLYCNEIEYEFEVETTDTCEEHQYIEGLEEEKNYILYDEKYKEQLKVYGTKSGKDIDKDFVTNFHPIKINDAVTYEEAHTTIVCKKIYQAKLEPQFYLNDVADQFYGINNDLTRHHMYIGEIERIVKK